MRVALVHDWLTGMRGGEYVLEAIAELFPQAELFTLVFVPGKVSTTLSSLKRHTSVLQRIPGIESSYRHFLPMMPKLIEQFDLSDFDLVISSSHCVAKGVRKNPTSMHVSYVHAPMRYIWDRFDDYFGKGRASLSVRIAAKGVRSYLQNWDRKVTTPERVDGLIANSHFIAQKIKEIYQRDSKVIAPFVDGERFSTPRKPGKEYLIVGAFAPYKRVDLAVQAFNELGLPLWIIGGGQDEKKLREMAGPTVQFLGALTNAEIADHFSRCKAFVFPGKEDFGITPLEAMAAGAPVIAYGEGGALDTVTEKTGLFFQRQTVFDLSQAIQKLESGEVLFREEDCRARAKLFSKQRFQTEFKNALKDFYAQAGKAIPTDF